MSLPLVAIVGAPNVGKSTLFNRLVGRRQALVTHEPGTTRDRLYGAVHESGGSFRVVDTGGLTPREAVPFAREVERQAAVAVAEAALVLFVVDARNGPGALELEIATILRRSPPPVLLVANKVDAPGQGIDTGELFALGFGEPHAISAEHGLGLDELVDDVVERLRGEQSPAAAEPAVEELRVAIVGRPNVGKSSLLNRLVGEERVLVSELPGTTRDAIDTLLEIDGRRFRLIDTAGLRRPGRIRGAPEQVSVRRARDNIARCDVAILVLDAEAGLAAQDGHIAGLVQDAYRPMVVAVNKWDRIERREVEAREWERRIGDRLRFAGRVPLVLISARTGQRVLRLLEVAAELHRASGVRVPTTALNRWLRGHAAGDAKAPPPRNQLRVYYATQSGIHPPTFLLFCNDPARAHFSVRRQLANSLREGFGLGPVPIRLQFRRRRPSA